MTTTYNVYRRIAPAAQSLLVSGLTSPAYTDTGLTNDVEVGYQVSATNEAGEGPKCAEVLVTPTAPDPPTGNSTTVSSIAALKTALLDDALDEIILTNGVYHISPASAQASDSLYIGSAFAGRTNPVNIRPGTPGGVIFDGGGATSCGGITFQAGACFQTWSDFKFANMTPTGTAVVVFGGDPTLAPPHDITMNNPKVLSTCHRAGSLTNNEHAFYFAHALTRGPYNIVLNAPNVDGSGSLGLWAAIHGFHGDAAHPPADNVTINNLVVTGTYNPIILWYDGSGANLHDWLIDTATISGAHERALRWETPSATNVIFRDITSTGSTLGGYYSGCCGPTPSGVTFDGCSLA